MKEMCSFLFWHGNSTGRAGHRIVPFVTLHIGRIGKPMERQKADNNPQSRYDTPCLRKPGMENELRFNRFKPSTPGSVFCLFVFVFSSLLSNGFYLLI